MPSYIVTGKLGTGKGKYGVQVMRDAAFEVRRVATNFDLWPENLMPANNRLSISRVPDRPTPADLDAVGHGNPDSMDEEKNGVMVLDEAGSWLNARSFGDKGRSALIDWFIHARKKGWDCYLIVQDLDMIDKQLRKALAEYLVKCVRLDRVKIPLIGPFLGKYGKMPRCHMANISLQDVPGVVVDREWYRADDVNNAYDTRQIFREWARNPADEGFRDEKFMGSFSYLSAWHLKGRHSVQGSPQGWVARLLARGAKPPLRPKLPLVQRLERLPPDRRWYYARQLNLQGVL
ncbi:zonular occludens toxin domain-containing protein [Caenimonas soli]|uniref:zonular occludens toxin domain-containing protein n=1 Tax=Caenimonas soli TaxID=2735555 RepID=UPI0015571A94|nr:zonular occludens toxin domain-containing protein [Caenimonas soli]NPC57009.1 zonular occludens toxin [Caenimonas soli]